MSKALGQKIAIKFDSEIIGDVSGNAPAFTVTGQEYNYLPDGILIDGDYRVESVSAHPSQENTILLTMNDSYRFNNAVGDLTVSYNKSLGTLAGLGGQVESFSVSFTPSDLQKKDNPNAAEHIELSSITAAGTYIRVYYTNSYADERVEISDITATATLININDL